MRQPGTASAGTPGGLPAVTYRAGNILREEAFANPVNLVGVMGAGLARQVRGAWPGVMHPYRIACRTRALREGTVLAWRRDDGGWIVNTPTKRHWRDPSDLELVDASIRALAAEARRLALRTIAVPPLGCGLGGLPWNVVHDMLRDTWRGHGTRLRIYGSPPGV